MRQHPFLESALAAGVFSVHLHAADFHVSPAGKDSDPGTAAAHFATLDAARKFAGKEPVTIQVADGKDYLPATLVLPSQDSGTAQHPVTGAP